MKRTSRSILLTSLTALATAVTAPTVLAQSTRAMAPMQLAIPPGDLGAALSAFSRATDLQVVVDPALIAGKRSAGLSGSFAVVDALTRLLAGSGPSFTVAGDSLLVRRGQQTSGTEPAASMARVVAADVSNQSVEQSESMEEVVVTAGFANSLARSLDEKRDANNVVDVI